MTKKKTFGIIGARILFSLLLVTSTLGTGLTELSAEPKRQMPFRVIADEPAIIEATHVARLIGLAMAEGTDSISDPPVRFARKRALPPVDSTIREKDFNLGMVTVTGHDASEEDPRSRTARGVLVHSDPYSRFIYTYFTADYRVLDNGSVALDDTETRPIEPVLPRVAVFCVPADKIPQDIERTYRGPELLEYVIKNAVDVRGPKKTDCTMKNYYVFAFFMERLAEDAEVGLLISDRADDLSGSDKNTVTFQENGFHVAYAPVRFALEGTSEVFFKAVFTPGSYTPPGQRQPRLVEVFTSESVVKKIQQVLAARGYNPGPADGIMGKRTQGVIRQFQQDQKLVADGNSSATLLDILTASGHPSAVQLAQLALLRLGYDLGPVDGIMGKRTRETIQEFQRDQDLTADGNLSIDLLAKMIVLSGRIPAPEIQDQPQVSETEVAPTSTDVQKMLEAKMWPNHVRQP